MLAAVDLDHQTFLETDEVENVVLERDLSAKLESGEPTIPQQPPHRCLGVGWLMPHLSRKLAETPGRRSMGRFSRHQPLTQMRSCQRAELPSPTRGEGTAMRTAP